MSETELTSSASSISDKKPIVTVQKLSYYEDIINYIGYGRFHIALTLICGWANASDAVEVMCIGLILPSAQCELNMNSSELGWLSAIVFLGISGMLIGGYVWGSIADEWGRRRTACVALFINAVFGILSSFATNFAWFIIARFISGVGVGGSIPVLWSYFVEFQPARHRGTMISFLATFWMIGQLFTAGLGWILIPMQSVHFYIGNYEMASWRIFLMLATFTCVSSALLLLLLPESPKFLLDKQRPDEALAILRRIYHINSGNDGRDLPVSSINTSKPSDDACTFGDEDQVHSTLFEPTTCGAKTKLLLKKITTHTLELFKPPWLRPMVALMIIYFALSFGYYGLNLWFPELIARARSSGLQGSICETIGHNVTQTTLNCTAPPDPIVFRDDFLIALASLPGNVVTVTLLDIVGRKAIFVVGIVLSAVSAFMIYFVATQTEVLIMSCVFSAVSILAWNCLDAFSAESFPTHLRATAMGIGLVLARIGAIIGNVLFGTLVDSHCAVPLVVVALLLGFGAIASFFMPNATRKNIG